MAQTKFVSIEALDGVVNYVEGDPNPNQGWRGEIMGTSFVLIGRRVNDALLLLDKAGYEHFSTETASGNRMIYRFKLEKK